MYLEQADPDPIHPRSSLSTFPFNTKYLVNPIFKTIPGFCIGLQVYILLVRVNPVVDENQKEESWKLRRPVSVVTL